MKRFTILALLMASITVSAEEPRDIRAIMSDISDSLFNLLPVLHERTADPDEFFGEINRLESLLEDAAPHFKDQPGGSQVTYDVLLEQVHEAAEYEESMNVMVAQWVLAQSFELCASCHKQDGRSRRIFGVSRFHDMDEFTAAEYSYLTRDYESALASYHNFLDVEPDDQFRRHDAFGRLLSIHLEVMGNIEGAIRTLSELQARSMEKERISRWLDALTRLQGKNAPASPLDAKSFDELEAYLAGELQPIDSLFSQEQRQIYWLLARHRIEEMMGQDANREYLPALYYWFAVSDRSTYFQFYDSISRRYLEQCVREFPSSPYASRCFDEYELLMIVSYSGSGGINIPEAVSREINELRKIVQEHR